MNANIQRLFLVTIGLLFCVLGCTRDRAHMLMPDHISQPTEVMEHTDIEASFEQDILPILTARCALAGCHVADGPHGLDFRTYESFIAGGEHGSVFIPGNAAGSEIVEEIVEGKMPPPPRDPLSDTELQIIINWINQQESHDDSDPHEDTHDEDADEHDDMDEEHDEDVHDEDADVKHHDEDDDGHADDDMDDDHDDDDDDDNGHAEDDDDNGHEDDEHDDDDDDN